MFSFEANGLAARPWQISRRTALRGLGAAVALPLLEAMIPSAAGAEMAPLRTAFLYVPNGVHMPAWTPQGVGREFELTPILQPLQAVKEEILVLSGLLEVVDVDA